MGDRAISIWNYSNLAIFVLLLTFLMQKNNVVVHVSYILYCFVCFTVKCTRVTMPTNVYLCTVFCYSLHAATDAVLVIIIIIMMSIVPQGRNFRQ